MDGNHRTVCNATPMDLSDDPSFGPGPVSCSDGKITPQTILQSNISPRLQPLPDHDDILQSAGKAVRNDMKQSSTADQNKTSHPPTTLRENNGPTPTSKLPQICRLVHRRYACPVEAQQTPLLLTGYLMTEGRKYLHHATLQQIHR